MGGFDSRQFQDILQQAQKQAEAMQEKMRQTVVEASAGGGAVTVKMNGQKQLLETTILQDLVTAAVNEATRKIDQAMQASVGGMLGGLGIPGT